MATDQTSMLLIIEEGVQFRRVREVTASHTEKENGEQSLHKLFVLPILIHDGGEKNVITQD